MQKTDDLPDGLDALNRYRNGWQLDHDNRRKPRLAEFDAPPSRRNGKRRRTAFRQPPMLGTVRRTLGEIR